MPRITQAQVNAFFRVKTPSVATDMAGNQVVIAPSVVVDEENFMAKFVEIDERFGVRKGNYAINRKGEILNLLQNRIMTPTLSPSHGYMCLALHRAEDASGNLLRPNSGFGRPARLVVPRSFISMLVHRLVGMVFIPNHNPLHKVIDHIDRNPCNNNYKNLRWCCQRANANNKKNNSKYWSVRWSKKYKKFQACVVTTKDNNPKETFTHSLGYFETEEGAARAVKAFMKETYPNEMGSGRRFIED
jgi:hypothetical protein